MSVFGVGPLELLVVLVVALLVVGPEGLVSFARRWGQWLRRVRQHPAWRDVQRVSYELQHWQETLLRESGLWDIRPRDPDVWLWHAPPPWREGFGPSGEGFRGEMLCIEPARQQQEEKADEPVGTEGVGGGGAGAGGAPAGGRVDPRGR